MNETWIAGRNSVLEAIRAGRPIERVCVQDGLKDGPVQAIVSAAKNAGLSVRYETKERLQQLSGVDNHQGVVAYTASYEYSSVEEMLQEAHEKGEAPFVILLDGIEDPHNLGSIIRTAHQAGAHGVIIRENRAVGLTATVAKTSAGALNYTKVAKVTNIAKTMDELKKEGLWFVCADMDGTRMYDLPLTGPVGLVVGAEGNGVSRLVKEHCDFIASVPMVGKIDSLNASVAAAVLMYEIVRQRLTVR